MNHCSWLPESLNHIQSVKHLAPHQLRSGSKGRQYNVLVEMESQKNVSAKDCLDQSSTVWRKKHQIWFPKRERSLGAGLWHLSCTQHPNIEKYFCCRWGTGITKGLHVSACILSLSHFPFPKYHLVKVETQKRLFKRKSHQLQNSTS